MTTARRPLCFSTAESWRHDKAARVAIVARVSSVMFHPKATKPGTVLKTSNDE